MKNASKRPYNPTMHRTARKRGILPPAADAQAPQIDYRAAIVFLAKKVEDEQAIRRVWRILENAYAKQ